MKQFTNVFVLAISMVLLLGCESTKRTGYVDVSLEEVKGMLKGELTVDGVYERLGSSFNPFAREGELYPFPPPEQLLDESLNNRPYKVMPKPNDLLLSSRNWGNFYYKMSDGRDLVFWYKGKYVVEARYGKIYLKGCDKHIYGLGISDKNHFQPDTELKLKFTLKDKEFTTADTLKEYISVLPKGSVIDYYGSCEFIVKEKRVVIDRLLWEVKELCQKNGLVFIYYPAG